MVNQLKIITMTRLALYDKHEGPGDRAANDYFRHDYIYRNNLGTRLAVGCGSAIILVIYWLRAFVINEMDLFEINIQQYATESFLFILAVLAAYSLIGTIQGTRQYYLVQKRLAQYQALVRQLERLEERTQRVYEDEPMPKSTVPRPATRTSPTIRRPAPGHTGPLVRTGMAPSSGAAVPLGHTRPPRTVSSDGVMPSRPVASDGTRPSRPAVSSDSTMPPRPVSTEVVRRPPPRPALPEGYTRPPRPMPYPPKPPSESVPTSEDPATLELEHTKIPIRPKNPEGS